jgi:hypothetical protein
MPGNPAIQTGSFTLQIGGHNMHHNHVERGHNRQNYHSDRGYNIQTGGTQAALPYKKTWGHNQQDDKIKWLKSKFATTETGW